MPTDHMRYDILVQEALRRMVRDVLTSIAKTGLAGDHHFFISFGTTSEGVRISERLRAQYPEEMTIVLQHQFWDLKVTEDAFEVGLSFGGVAERLYVPFDAVRCFADPSVQFTLQFETLDEAPADMEARKDEQNSGRTRDQPRSKPRKSARDTPAQSNVTANPLPEVAGPDSAQPPNQAQDQSSGKTSADVVRLDRFRKK
jgi:uncharacterized protein